jgi:hypothetical protein
VRGQQVSVETRKLRGGNAGWDGAKEVCNTGGDAVPKESVKCIGGEDARRIATDGVTIEEEGREEGSEADGLIDRFFYKAVDKFGGTHGRPQNLVTFAVDNTLLLKVATRVSAAYPCVDEIDNGLQRSLKHLGRNFGAKEDGSLAWGKLKAKWGEAAIEGRIKGGSGGDKSGKSTGDYVGRAYDVDVIGVGDHIAFLTH